MESLGEFEGRPVVRTTIKVINAGDGLSKAVAIEPHLLHSDDEVIVVMRCKVGAITFQPGDGKDGVDFGESTRVQTLKAGTATIMESAAIEKALAAQAKKVAMEDEKKKGISRLPIDEGADDDSRQ